jgi:signal transduction histidine kinase
MGAYMGMLKSPKDSTGSRGSSRTFESTLGPRIDAKQAKRGFRLSFKNRILISTLTVLIGGVIAVGAILQITVFPQLKGDSAAVTNLKIVHLFAGLIVIVISWAFIELISKKITLPLLELTERADQISREAGTYPTSGTSDELTGSREPTGRESAVPASGDEIDRLKISFYRMLAHLKASEARLKDSEEKYRFLFDNAPFPLFVLNAEDLSILDVNQRAIDEYQYGQEEFLRMKISHLTVPEDREEAEKLLKPFTVNDEESRVEYASGISQANSEAPMLVTPDVLPVLNHKRKDGTSLNVHVQAYISWFRDKPAIIAGTWDVTEKLEQEARLVQTSKMATLGEMATGIAHELNQPLNVIKIASDFLMKNIRRDRAPTREELIQTAEELGSNVERASLIINHLREFGRRADETMRPININTPIRGVFTLLGAQLRKSGIELELYLGPGLPLITGDENRLEQVFINLVVNARDAMLSSDTDETEKSKKREKALWIESFAKNDRVIVKVSDTGPGVPEGLRQKIFEPFFTTKKVGQGTGIGLSISYSIIKEHSGTIEIDGKRKGGATFVLEFPATNR